MDAKTRGIIEKGLDLLIEETDMRERIRWVLREITVHSQEDFALGYLIGSLTRYAYDQVRMQKVFKRLQKNREREFGKERVQEIEREAEKSEYAHKPFRVYWTKKDETEFRNMLRNRLVYIRRKVSRDFHR